MTECCSYIGFPGIDFSGFFSGGTLGGVFTFFSVQLIGSKVVNEVAKVSTNFSNIEMKLNLMKRKEGYDIYIDYVKLDKKKIYTEKQLNTALETKV